MLKHLRILTPHTVPNPKYSYSRETGTDMTRHKCLLCLAKFEQWAMLPVCMVLITKLKHKGGHLSGVSVVVKWDSFNAFTAKISAFQLSNRL